MDRRGGFHRPAPRVRAFTIFEILIVLGLLVLLVGISWPVLQNQITGAHLPESADRIRDMLYMVRSEAAMEHRRYRIRFAPEEQQPVIEYEPDPIREPGRWEPIDSPWAREPFLLADVQIHEIRLGRPKYLRPQSEDEDRVEEEQRGFEDEGLEADEFLDTAASLMDDEEQEIDESRPLIIFEADGSAEWATFILSKKPLDQVLEEEDSQLWVVLDGRTGLARVREKVTEDQLSDPEFYVKREKLELPDELNTDELMFQVGNDPSEGFAGDGSNDTVGMGEEAGGAFEDGDTGLAGLGGGQPTGDTGGTGESGRRDLKEADLTEEEQMNILRTLGRGR